jgi:hypothetical protein
MKKSNIKKKKEDNLTKEDKRIEKILSSTMKRYVGGLSEEFQSRIEVIGEQYSGIIKRLDEHGEILNRHSEILNEHTRILDRHSEILERHDKKLDSHTEMIGSVMVSISDIKESLANKVDRTEFTKTMSQINSKLINK